MDAVREVIERAEARATALANADERIYRKQLRPVIQTGATAMDTLFGDELLRGGEDA